MGKEIAPSYANIYMAHLEETVLPKCPHLSLLLSLPLFLPFLSEMASPTKTPKEGFRALLELSFFDISRHTTTCGMLKKNLWVNIQSHQEFEKTITQLINSSPVAELHSTTRARLESNAETWAQGSLETMELHYQQIINGLVPQILQVDQKDRDEAWKIASKWMKGRYKTTFKEAILDWAQKRVNTLLQSLLVKV